LPFDATRAADQDATSIAFKIRSYVSKKMKLIPEEKELKVLGSARSKGL